MFFILICILCHTAIKDLNLDDMVTWYNEPCSWSCWNWTHFKYTAIIYIFQMQDTIHCIKYCISLFIKPWSYLREIYALNPMNKGQIKTNDANINFKDLHFNLVST